MLSEAQAAQVSTQPTSSGASATISPSLGTALGHEQGQAAAALHDTLMLVLELLRQAEERAGMLVGRLRNSHSAVSEALQVREPGVGPAGCSCSGMGAVCFM